MKKKIHMFISKEKENRTKKEKNIHIFRKKFSSKQKIIIKIIFIICLTLAKLELLFYSNTKETKKELKNYKYFICFVSKGKSENLYVRELVNHYLSIEFEKFYLGDDNIIGGEKLIDVLHDYVNKNIVDIKDIRGKNWSQVEFFQYTLEKYKDKCKWMSFYDFDEFLEFTNKNMTIKDYLSMDIFNKCDVVKIHWLIYDDNDLVYYDNRTLKERFTKPIYQTFDNNFHKSIVRSKNYNGIMWNINTGVHQPNESLVNMCDAVGTLANVRHGILGHPNYKYCHIRHHRMKTIEEYRKNY